MSLIVIFERKNNLLCIGILTFSPPANSVTKTLSLLSLFSLVIQLRIRTAFNDIQCTVFNWRIPNVIAIGNEY